MSNKSKKSSLTPSWNFLPSSILLAQKRPYSVFWLVLIPSILLLTGQKIVNDLLATKYPEPSAVSIGDQSHLILSQGQIGLAIICIAALWSLLVYPATLVFATNAVRGATDHPLSYLASSWKYFWRIYGLVILTNLIIFIGLLALIVPGLILARRYILSPYYLIERNLGIIEAMKLSSNLSKSYKSEIWGSIGVLVSIAFTSSIVATFGWAGLLLGPIVGVLYFFGLSLRQKEISEIHKP